jgi:serine protease Do
MGLGTDIVQYITERTLEGPKSAHLRTAPAFLNAHSKYGTDVIRPYVVMKKLADAAVLLSVGVIPGEPPSGGEMFYSKEHPKLHHDYGVFDFIADGFPSIRKHFQESVLHLTCEKRAGEPQSGTAFVFFAGSVITARHCVEDMAHVSIWGWSPAKNPLRQIEVYGPPFSDLARLTFEKNSKPPVSAPGILVEPANVLDRVMPMGYPLIPGFDNFLVASVGEIVGAEQALLDKNNYFLLSARVTGGNSGGPVFNERGSAIGIVSAAPSDREKLEAFGYGLALPLMPWAAAFAAGSLHGEFLSFRQDERGFTTAMPQ